MDAYADQAADVAADMELLLPCEDGLARWPSGPCAPAVSSCQPWELPLIGGACLPIGPRACPRTYDPDSDFDCEPGSLLDCPPGFVVDEDGLACSPEYGTCGTNEVPLPGGECLLAGPADGNGKPLLFDVCSDGAVPLPAGGCLAVGPRACPLLWDPASKADCLPGDLLPCPEGWLESPDGLLCQPLLDECPAGQLPIPGGGCQPVLATPCPEGPFPPAPEGAAGLLFVDADSPCETGCGSQEAPYPTILQALEAAGDGAAVLVAAGSYQEALVLAAKQVKLIGLCAAKTEVLQVESQEDEEAPPGPVLSVIGGGHLEAAGFRIQATGPAALLVGEGSSASLANLEVSQVGQAGNGITLETGAALEASALWIHAETACCLGGYPACVRLQAGSLATLDDSLLEDCLGAGLVVEGQGAVAVLSDVTVRGVRAEGVALEEVGGVLVEAGGSVTAGRVLLERNAGRNVGVKGTGAAASFDSSVFRLGQPVEGLAGFGADVQSGGTLEVHGSYLAQNTEKGIRCGGSGTHVVVESTAVVDTQCRPDGTRGDGFQGVEGCQLSIAGSAGVGNHFRGLNLWSAATSADVRYSVVRGTLPSAVGEEGVGFVVGEGAGLELVVAAVEGSMLYGGQVGGQGASARFDGSVIRDSGGTGGLTAGLTILGGGTVEIASSLFERNRELGIFLMDQPSQLVLADSAVRGTDLGPAAMTGVGVLVLDGTAQIERCLVADSAVQGVVGGSASLSLTRCVIADTRAEFALDAGIGLWAIDSAADVAETLIRNAALVGMAASGNSYFQASRCAVLDIQPDWAAHPKAPAAGLAFNGGAAFAVVDTLVRDVAANGLSAVGVGTHGTVERMVVNGVSRFPEATGVGLGVVDGASLTAAGCLVEGCEGTGLLVSGQGADAHLERSVVRGCVDVPGPTGKNQGGQGLMLLSGGTARLSGVLFDGNAIVGGIAHAACALEVVGTQIRNTRMASDGSGAGHGFVAMQGAEAHFRRSSLSGNSTVGLAAHGIGTKVTVEDCAVTGTLPGGAEESIGGKTEVFGDAVASADGAQVELSRTLIADNSRTGAYYFGGAGRLEGCLITANQSYGLAIEGNLPVEHEGLGNFIFGNALALPEAHKADVTTSPGALPPPPPPGLDTEM